MVLYHTPARGVSRHKKASWFYQEVLGRRSRLSELDVTASLWTIL